MCELMELWIDRKPDPLPTCGGSKGLACETTKGLAHYAGIILSIVALILD